MAQNWNSHCNKDAYGQDGNFVDNRKKTEFKGGRSIYYLDYTKPKKEHALNFTFDDKKKIGGKTEFQWFIYWYEVTLKSGTEAFYFPDIITHTGYKLYKLKTPPKWKGQQKKEITTVFEEV